MKSSLLVIFATLAAAQTAAPGGIEATLASGIRVGCQTIVSAPAGVADDFGGGFQPEGETVRRFLYDKANLRWLGYDLTVSVSASGYSVSIGPLSRVDEMTERFAPGLSLRPAAQPRYPPPQTLREGDIIAFDLMTSPNGRQKLTDYIRVSGPGATEITTRESPASFKTRFTLVAVPVIVTDSQGRSIGTLDRQDFQLFDDGKPQAISRFSVEQAAAPKAQSGVPARFLAFVFDDMHSSAEQLAPARQAAQRYISTALGPGDRAAIFTTSGGGDPGFTGDREALVQALALARGASCRDVLPLGYGLNVQPAYDSLRARSALDGLRGVFRALAHMPGKRLVALVTPGFAQTEDWRYEQTDLIETAVRAGIVVNVVDPGVTYATLEDFNRANQAATPPLATYDCAGRADLSNPLDHGVPEDLASGTGGRVLLESNLDERFRLAAVAPEHLYLLGFTPQNLKLDGKFHGLRVEIKKPSGLTVQARRGYYTARYEESPAEQVKRELEEAFFSGEQIHDLPASMETQFYKTGEDRATVAILAKVDLKQIPFRKEEGRNRNDLTVISGLFNADGDYIEGIQKIVAMRLKDETLAGRMVSGLTVRTTLNVPPGRYGVRLVVRDAEGQRLTAESGAVEIP
jgi:VWFA-related protein